MALKRPRRHRFDSEPEFLLACLRYLDAKYPGREGQRKRLSAWKRWSDAHDVDTLRERIRDLVALDEWTDDEAAEFDRLAEAWRNRARSARPTPDITKENNS